MYNSGVISLFRLRPEYERRTELPPAAVRDRVSAALAEQGAACSGEVDDDKIHIMTRGEHHFWSPELRARIDPAAAGAHLYGRFGPRPAVWTMFMVIYAHLAFAAIAGGCYAMAQLALGRSPTAALALPIAVAVAVVVHVVARIGQRLGADEMDEIRAFLSTTLES